MLSTRTFTRLLQRTSPLSRLSSISTRTVQPCLHRLAVRSIAPIQRPFVSRFSTAAVARQAGAVDQELSTKLSDELEWEKTSQGRELSETAKEFLESGWKLNDPPGKVEVELVKNFGDEKIKVEFSITDLTSMPHDQLDDNAFYDEDEEADSNDVSDGPQSRNTKKSGRTQVANQAEEDDDDDEEAFSDEEDAQPSLPISLKIVIEKAKSALKFSAVVQDGMIVIQDVIWSSSPQVLHAQTPDTNWDCEVLYSPNFMQLDEDLQGLFDKYLDERGINTALAFFVQEYAEHKEQNEFVRWLENVNSFVSA